jgi:transcriptional regulator with XRE-family HTH domain
MLVSAVGCAHFMRESMSNTNFAERLREIREKTGLSQYALAKKSGLTKQALSRLELGEREPTWQTVQLLAAALGVDCREFVDPSLQPPASEPGRSRGRPKKRESQAATEENPPKKTRKRKESK